MPATAADIAHLLKRSGFAAPTAQVNGFVQANADLDTVVDWVLDLSRAPGELTVPAWSDTSLSNWERYVAYVQAWYDRMATTSFPIAEKMTLFWHNHFVSSLDATTEANMFRQMALYRANALGNLRTLTHAMAIDPAMLEYLDNASNTVNGPQQNFARELMELFTMGVGNYTEFDVIEVARAWTGHGVEQNATYVFRSNRHDNGNKTIFGVTQNWDGPQVIDAIFTNSTKRQATARFIVGKLWTYFAHRNPPANVVTDLANAFIAANFEIRPLLRALFLRPEFYTTTAKQGLVRSPVEFIVATMKAVGLDAGLLHPEWFEAEMGQVLLRPSSVAGWGNNDYWLSTTGLKGRGDLATHIHWKLNELKRHPAGVTTGLTPAQVVARVLTALDMTVASVTRSALEASITQARANGRSWNDSMVIVSALLSADHNLA